LRKNDLQNIIVFYEKAQAGIQILKNRLKRGYLNFPAMYS